MTRRPNHDARRALAAMRELLAKGITCEALLVDQAATVIGGDEAAKMTAQRVYDKHYRIMSAV